MRTVSIEEAAIINSSTECAIYTAIRKNKLPRTEGRIPLHALKEYIDKKYDRSKSMYNGELRYDKSKGEYSVVEAARYLDTTDQFVYNVLRTGKLKYTKKGHSYVIFFEDLKAFKKNFIE